VVLSLPPLTLSVRLLAATRFAGDEVGRAGEEVLLRGFVGRGSGEELEGLEVVRLHLGVVGGGETTASETEDSEEQGKLGDEGSQVADDALGAADVTGGGVADELGAATDKDQR